MEHHISVLLLRQKIKKRTSKGLSPIYMWLRSMAKGWIKVSNGTSMGGLWSAVAGRVNRNTEQARQVKHTSTP